MNKISKIKLNIKGGYTMAAFMYMSPNYWKLLHYHVLSAEILHKHESGVLSHNNDILYFY